MLTCYESIKYSFQNIYIHLLLHSNIWIEKNEEKRKMKEHVSLFRVWSVLKDGINHWRSHKIKEKNFKIRWSEWVSPRRKSSVVVVWRAMPSRNLRAENFEVSTWRSEVPEAWSISANPTWKEVRIEITVERGNSHRSHRRWNTL